MRKIIWQRFGFIRTFAWLLPFKLCFWIQDNAYKEPSCRYYRSIEDKTWTSVFKVVWAKNNYLKIGENDELETFNKKMKPSASMPRRDNKLVGIKLHWRLKFWPKSSSLGKPAGDYHYYLKCGTLHGKLPSLLTRQNFANSDNYFPKENHKNLAHLV